MSVTIAPGFYQPVLQVPQLPEVVLQLPPSLSILPDGQGLQIPPPQFSPTADRGLLKWPIAEGPAAMQAPHFQAQGTWTSVSSTSPPSWTAVAEPTTMLPMSTQWPATGPCVAPPQRIRSPSPLVAYRSPSPSFRAGAEVPISNTFAFVAPTSPLIRSSSPVAQHRSQPGSPGHPQTHVIPTFLPPIVVPPMVSMPIPRSASPGPPGTRSPQLATVRAQWEPLAATASPSRPIVNAPPSRSAWEPVQVVRQPVQETQRQYQRIPSQQGPSAKPALPQQRPNTPQPTHSFVPPAAATMPVAANASYFSGSQVTASVTNPFSSNPANPFSSGPVPVLGRAIQLPGPGESPLDWLGNFGPSAVPEELSSIHVLSGSTGGMADKDEKQDLFEYCRDTTKLVQQMAAVMKGLEAQVAGLRKDNLSLRKTVMSLQPAQQFHESASSTPRLMQSMGTEQDIDESSQSALMAASTQSLMTVTQPLTARSTPPPSARIALPLITQERTLMHTSPHFGVNSLRPTVDTSNVSIVQQIQQLPDTPTLRAALPSAGGYPLCGSRGPTLQPPGSEVWQAPMDVSPALDSNATLLQNQEDSICAPMSPNLSPATVEVFNGLWSTGQAIWLGADAALDRFNQVRILDPETVVSVSFAVEGLNRGSFKCPEDVCIVYSASNQGYYLLYRQGKRDKAFALATVELASPAPVPVPVTVMVEPPMAPLATIAVNPSMSSSEGARPATPPLQGPSLPQTPSVPMDPGSKARSLGSTIEAEPADALSLIIEFANRNEIQQAEELLQRATRDGIPANEACYNAVIAAFDRRRQPAKAEEWLWRALQSGVVPGEASFTSVILAGCKQGATLKVEDTMTQMIHMHIRPSKEVFEQVIRLFAEQQNAGKVEEWLLNAGQAGWTPEQAAFENVVNLFAEVDVLKAEEWLRRTQETEYRLSESCYDSVIVNFLRSGDIDRAEDVLMLMIHNGLLPSEVILQEVLAVHAAEGRLDRYEGLLDALERDGESIDGLRNQLIETALQGGDIECAERQLLLLRAPNAAASQQASAELLARGEALRAQQLLEQYLNHGGEATAEVYALLASTCGALGDADGLEAAAHALAMMRPLTEMQAMLLRQVLGDERAEGILQIDVSNGAGSRRPSLTQSSAPSTKQTQSQPPRRNSTASNSNRTQGSRANSGAVSTSSASTSATGTAKAASRQANAKATTSRGRGATNTR